MHLSTLIFFSVGDHNTVITLENRHTFLVCSSARPVHMGTAASLASLYAFHLNCGLKVMHTPHLSLMYWAQGLLAAPLLPEVSAP